LGKRFVQKLILPENPGRLALLFVRISKLSGR
jgi:hypothetical protein